MVAVSGMTHKVAETATLCVLTHVPIATGSSQLRFLDLNPIRAPELAQGSDARVEEENATIFSIVRLNRL
jgi:hypothetical protein